MGKVIPFPADRDRYRVLHTVRKIENRRSLSSANSYWRLNVLRPMVNRLSSYGMTKEEIDSQIAIFHAAVMRELTSRGWFKTVTPEICSDNSAWFAKREEDPAS